jgi:hypothetical protein
MAARKQATCALAAATTAAADLNDDAAASADIHNLFFRWALGCIMVSGLQRVTCLTLHYGRSLPACLRRPVVICDTF